MKRRSFLKAVAAAAPAVGLQEFLVNRACAQAPASPPASGLHVIRDGVGWPFSVLEGLGRAVTLNPF